MSDQNDGIEQDRVYKSEDALKNGWKRVKRFVNEHPTISASVVTGVISWKLSKRHTLKKVYQEVGPMVYNYGTEAGTLEAQRDILLDFIAANGLKGQAIEYVQAIHKT